MGNIVYKPGVDICPECDTAIYHKNSCVIGAILRENAETAIVNRELKEREKAFMHEKVQLLVRINRSWQEVVDSLVSRLEEKDEEIKKLKAHLESVKKHPAYEYRDRRNAESRGSRREEIYARTREQALRKAYEAMSESEFTLRKQVSRLTDKLSAVQLALDCSAAET